MSIIKYTIIRSQRKTLSLEVNEDGQVIVRAPQQTSLGKIDGYVRKHFLWILRKMNEMEQVRRHRRTYTDEEREKGILLAKTVIPQRVEYFAKIMGVSYGKITIREQKTRWGSCSAKGNLNFNWKLTLMPRDVLDYCVVHELAHRLEMNHSEAFWAVVEGVLPDYRRLRETLDEYGRLL